MRRSHPLLRLNATQHSDAAHQKPEFGNWKLERKSFQSPAGEIKDMYCFSGKFEGAPCSSFLIKPDILQEPADLFVSQHLHWDRKKGILMRNWWIACRQS